VARIICGVDVSSISLEAFVAPKGATGSFHNTVEGISALLEFCQQQQVELLAMRSHRRIREKSSADAVGGGGWEWWC
jgi:transposase